MDIKQAKQQIKNAMVAYFSKDEFGGYRLPTERQRPVFLLGAPGIGKTAIMEQIAQELGVGLVSYSMTHHTRQSALGLPFIAKKTYGGAEYDVSEYTMSEIIAAVYDAMEATGRREGILFLDEINCVSETLTPAMLQFLQYKTFGRHRVPDGWIVVTAGNPPEYNKSVREFDVVTLDRVKRIDVQEDYQVWKEYAYQRGLHSAVISYLDIRPDNFYKIEAAADGLQFATARGWEDLSALLTTYEALDLPVDREVVGQYIQLPRIAKDFANYLELYRKYQRVYRVDEIVAGQWEAVRASEFAAAPFDEKLSVIGLILSRLSEHAHAAQRMDALTDALYADLTRVKGALTTAPVTKALAAIIEDRSKELESGRASGTLDTERKRRLQLEIAQLEQYLHAVERENESDNDKAFDVLRTQFGAQTAKRAESVTTAGQSLDNAFAFLEQATGESQEMVLFATELTANPYTAWYIQNCGCEAYFRHNQALLFDDTQRHILDEIQKAKENH